MDSLFNRNRSNNLLTITKSKSLNQLFGKTQKLGYSRGKDKDKQAKYFVSEEHKRGTGRKVIRGNRKNQ